MATAVIRQGSVTDQYIISDPGNASGFDGYSVFILWRTRDVVIERPNNSTFKEDLLCWSDADEVLCPNDDIGGGVLRMPVLTFLDGIMAAGGLTVGADILIPGEKEVFLRFWHEYRTEKLATDTVDQLVLEGLNAVQQRRALKFGYFMNGVDLVTAQSIADARINSGTVAKWNDYNLTQIPTQDKRLLNIIGEVASEFFKG